MLTYRHSGDIMFSMDKVDEIIDYIRNMHELLLMAEKYSHIVDPYIYKVLTSEKSPAC